MVVNPTTADMKNITDISFQPFSRKQSDLNYYIAQSLRIYGKTLDTSNEPVSCYIRGLEITDNGNTILIEPGVVFANNSIIILKDQVQLDKPSITSPTYIVVKYEYIEAWEPIVPELKFIEKINHDKNTEAIFGEFDSDGNLILWDEQKRQEEARNVYGFLSDIYTDQVFVPESTWPLSSKAVHSMLTGIIQNPPMFYGIIENNKLTIIDLHGNAQSEILPSLNLIGIGTAFRRLVSNTNNFPNTSGFSPNEFNLTFTWAEHRMSGILEGKNKENPEDMHYTEIYNQINMGGLAGTHLRGYFTKTDLEAKLTVYDTSGEYSIIQQDINTSTPTKMFLDYMNEIGIPEQEQKKYTFEFWDEYSEGKENVVIYYSGNNEWVERRVRINNEKFEIEDKSIVSSKLADNLTLNKPLIVSGVIDHPNIIQGDIVNSMIKSTSNGFSINGEGMIKSATIQDSVLEHITIKNYQDGGDPFNITKNEINWATLNNCKIDGDNNILDNTITPRKLKGVNSFRSNTTSISLYYQDNITPDSFTVDDYRGLGTQYPNTPATNHSTIIVPAHSYVFIQIITDILGNNINFNSETYTFNEILVNNNSERYWITSRFFGTKVYNYVFANTQSIDQTIHIRSNGFYEDAGALTMTIDTNYIITRSGY